MSKTNGEIFQQFMYEAYGIEPEPEPTPGPRKPAPVPEAGQAGPSPMAKEASGLNNFHETARRFLGVTDYR